MLVVLRTELRSWYVPRLLKCLCVSAFTLSDARSKVIDPFLGSEHVESISLNKTCRVHRRNKPQKMGSTS